MNLVILISGRGSDMQSILNAIDLGLLNVSVKLVISNNPDARGLEIANAYSVPTAVVSHKGRTREEFEKNLIEVIDKAEPELVILAGFMRKLTPLFVNHYNGKLINIHPALLPSFAGAHGHRDALVYGVKVSGCTVHFVNEEVDGGPIILQYPVFVHENDTEETLAARILVWEHRLLPLAVKLISEGRVTVNGRHVHIRDFDEDELRDWMENASRLGLE